ncbi:MAG: class I SAM-dependent methyltransferase [Bryobacteraceae bacterium]
MRGTERFLGETEFYEKNYTFFERPGAAVFDRPRYIAMATWIVEALSGYQPASILDAGCGRGWMMRELRERYPAAKLHGVEPSERESEVARQDGFALDTTKIDEKYPIDQRYQLVYCTNVVEHTTDPVQFLTILGELASPGGRIVVTCPDSSYPNGEFMFSDQNYSFTPAHLQHLAEAAGLHPLAWRPAPAVNSLRDKQLWVFGNKPGTHAVGKDMFRSVTPDQLFDERRRYVLSFEQCDRHLEQSVRAARRVYNFGTSTWSMLLRAYCPAYWQRVTSCVIDGGSGTFQEKPVQDFQSLAIEPEDAVVLGVNPYAQPEFAQRLRASGVSAIGWAHIVSR